MADIAKESSRTYVLPMSTPEVVAAIRDKLKDVFPGDTFGNPDGVDLYKDGSEWIIRLIYRD